MMLKTKKTKSFQSLWVTLAIAFSALSALVLLISSGSNMYLGFQNQQRLIINEQAFIAQNAANTVRAFVREKLGDLKTAAHLGGLVDAGQEDQELAMEKLLGLEPAFRQLVLLNAQDHELARVSRLSSLVSDQLTEQVGSGLFSHTDSTEPYIGPVYINQVTSEPLVIMAVPAKDVFGDFKGTLLAEVNLKFMWDLVGAIKVGDNGYAYVVDRQGRLIASGDISRVLKAENLANLKEVSEFVKGDMQTHQDDADTAKGLYGNYVVASHMHLGTPDWAVVVESPVLEAYKAVITTLSVSGLIIVLSFALAIIAGVYISKRITKPIIDLRDAAVKIGQGKLDTRIKISKNDEIGTLAESFNHMAEDLGKRTTSIVNLNREIAIRRKVETSLRQSEKRFEEVAENSGDWIWEINAEGLYTYSSPVVEKLLGYKPAEIVRKKYFYDFFDPDRREELEKAAFEAFARRDEFKGFINPNIHKNGSTVILETHGTPIVDDKGNLSGYRGADRDITERIRTEDALRKNEEFTRRVIESSSDCIKVLDLEGRLLSMSKGGQKILEIDDMALYLNCSFIDFWKGKEREDCLEAIAKAKKGRTGVFYGYFETAKGTPKSWEVIVTPIKDSDGNINSLLAVSRDITERKKAEESIENLNKDLKSTVALLTQSNRQLREFAHLAAHDLKTPLRGISTLAQWLVNDYKDKFDDQGRRQVELLVERVGRMDELVNAILEYSTIGRNKHKEHPVDLNKLIGSVLVETKPPPNIKITINKNLPVVICKEAHLWQIFHRLLANAIRFMDKPEGHITIDYIDKGDLWEFSVSDNGMGIAPQHFEKIFQLFQVLNDSD
ncbi:MAG: PAS domain S-box protein, partial [Phycisphaerae bacterium]